MFCAILAMEMFKICGIACKRTSLCPPEECICLGETTMFVSGWEIHKWKGPPLQAARTSAREYSTGLSLKIVGIQRRHPAREAVGHVHRSSVLCEEVSQVTQAPGS